MSSIATAPEILVSDHASVLAPVANTLLPLRVSVILPVIDETESLRKTVQMVLAENAAEVAEILIIVCRKTTERAMSVCRELAVEYPALVRVHGQVRPFLGGDALQAKVVDLSNPPLPILAEIHAAAGGAGQPRLLPVDAAGSAVRTRTSAGRL